MDEHGTLDPPIAVRETHIGVVFLVGDRAYKMKKPVRTEFLDFSTPQLRRAACRREVELNRRLAPDVYLGISDVGPPVDPSATGAAVEPAEHLVVMRRMPEDRRLATLVTSGEPVDDELREVARLMAAFHARADRSATIAVDGGRDALRGRWAANLAELAPFAGTVLDPALIDALGRSAMRFLDGRAPLFQDRLDQDRVVDGHGDLIAADVFCLDDGPRVLDCLEFDDHLRHVDGLDDVAFLAMDLERLGRADLADRFLEAYAEFSGDPAPAALRHHYIAYRAVVRAKVACLRRRQGDRAAAVEAAEYATLALRHLERGAVRLALVGGLPGTGKSTLGGALADRFGAVLLSSDRLRKELSGIDPDEHAAAPFREGLYTEQRTAAMYAELLHRAEVLLARGESVVLDASWTCARHRRAAEELARRTSSDLVELQCRTTTETADRRLVTRGHTASDATGAVSRAMSAAAEPWPEAVPIPTHGTVANSLELASSVWRGAPAGPRSSLPTVRSRQEPSMYARVNTIFGEQDKVDAGLAHVEGTDRPAVEAISGNRGLTTLVDRPAGVIVAMSYWDGPDHSSEAGLTRAREGAVAAAGGDLVAESYEVAIGERSSVPVPGATVRMARVRIEPARVADGLAFIRDEVLPRLRTGAGHHSTEVLIDRSSGGGVLVTAWADEDHATRVDTVLDQVDESPGRVGVTFPRTETYTLVGTSPQLG